MRICAVDPASVGLGLCICDVDEEKLFELVVKSESFEIDKKAFLEMLTSCCSMWVYETINLKELVDACRCKDLHHSNHMVDRVRHLINKYNEFFIADLVLIEAQLPGGFTDVQNIIMADLDRSKVQLIHAPSRNTFIGIARGETDRPTKKKCLVNFAMKFVSKSILQSSFSRILHSHLSKSQNTTYSEETGQEGKQRCKNVEYIGEAFIDCHDRVDAFVLVLYYFFKMWLPANKSKINTAKSNRRKPYFGTNQSLSAVFEQFRWKGKMQ